MTDQTLDENITAIKSDTSIYKQMLNDYINDKEERKKRINNCLKNYKVGKNGRCDRINKCGNFQKDKEWFIEHGCDYFAILAMDGYTVRGEYENRREEVAIGVLEKLARGDDNVKEHE
jgi:hypothetical protein